MKFILFCQNSYSFGILAPIKDYLSNNSHAFLWFVNSKILSDFPYSDAPHTTKISDLIDFRSDVIFVPGNEVPYYLRGLKVQIFHGFAGEKRGHFRIRHYFDLYLTQGPYFTQEFNRLKLIYKNFDVIETGWPKLDVYGQDDQRYIVEKNKLLQQFQAQKIIIYAPTFSPKLTSAPFLSRYIKDLAANPNYLVFLKFHPLLDAKYVALYESIAQEVNNIVLVRDKNIIPYLMMSDLLISDTSSVIYEFLLLNKPVVSFHNISRNIFWDNSSEYSELVTKVESNLTHDYFAARRLEVYQQYHPYNDGKSAERMVKAAIGYIKVYGVPEKRKISILRRWTIMKMFK